MNWSLDIDEWKLRDYSLNLDDVGLEFQPGANADDLAYKIGDHLFGHGNWYVEGQGFKRDVEYIGQPWEKIPPLMSKGRATYVLRRRGQTIQRKGDFECRK